jgi:arginase family enzyme
MTNLDAMLKKLQPGMVAVVGIPFDENSSFSRGPALAPKRIRKALNSGSANLCAEHGLEKA